MLQEAGVRVFKGERLAAVEKSGPRILSLTTEDGDVFRAKMFLDTTYEGDLLARAGVEYTLVREGNARYGERFNGIFYNPKYEPLRASASRLQRADEVGSGSLGSGFSTRPVRHERRSIKRPVAAGSGR